MKLRKANLADVEEMLNLVNKYAESGLMLPRSRNTLYEHIRDFVVVERDEQIVGTGALHIVWGDLAEIRALAVAPGFTKQGIGKQMVEYFLREAKELGIPKVFALTYQPDFFAKCGFVIVNKESMPQKVWKECINCPKFPNCDEICMEINIDLTV
ncbi:MAG: acetyltransferase, N-acetylglutamate synthase [Peptococcaceae bacterium]|jgi:amino-acid N-acetyltransferase|nr:acetyltransferase, N-acetylglutamate synthase [Peptococcaceae bacterium]